jgi:hypothetical protein
VSNSKVHDIALAKKMTTREMQTIDLQAGEAAIETLILDTLVADDIEASESVASVNTDVSQDTLATGTMTAADMTTSTLLYPPSASAGRVLEYKSGEAVWVDAPGGDVPAFAISTFSVGRGNLSIDLNSANTGTVFYITDYLGFANTITIDNSTGGSGTWKLMFYGMEMTLSVANSGGASQSWFRSTMFTASPFVTTSGSTPFIASPSFNTRYVVTISNIGGVQFLYSQEFSNAP